MDPAPPAKDHGRPGPEAADEPPGREADRKEKKRGQRLGGARHGCANERPQRELPLAPHVEKPRFVGKRNGQAGQELADSFWSGYLSPRPRCPRPPSRWHGRGRASRPRPPPPSPCTAEHPPQGPQRAWREMICHPMSMVSPSNSSTRKAHIFPYIKEPQRNNLYISLGVGCTVYSSIPHRIRHAGYGAVS